MDAKLVKITANTWAIFVDEADLNAIIRECVNDYASMIALTLSSTLAEQKEEQA